MDAIVRKWLTMSRAELDDIFRSASALTPPQGEMDGTIIVSGTPLAGLFARLIRALVWRGKVFAMSSPRSGMLVNKVTPLGVSAVRAQVYIGDSWLDGRKAIILDYSSTSFIASSIRDEIREVEPGLYLGKVWWRATRLVDFALTTPGAGPKPH
jgi:hypothetical protein